MSDRAVGPAKSGQGARLPVGSFSIRSDAGRASYGKRITTGVPMSYVRSEVIEHWNVTGVSSITT